MKENFGKLLKLLSDFAVVRRSHMENLNRIALQKDTFAAEYIEKQTAQENATFQQFAATMNDKFAAAAGDLVKAIETKRATWPGLESPKLANTLALIQLTGGSLPGETIRRIIETHNGDYQSLAALKAVTDKLNMTYASGLISESLYDVTGMEDYLNGAAYTVFQKNGSVNALGAALAQYAAKEGVDFPETVDAQSVTDAMRRGGGLPPAKPTK
jgi:hypothetical protein